MEERHHVEFMAMPKRSKVLEQAQPSVATTYMPSKEQLLICLWALVEIERLAIGHQVVMRPELPSMSCVLLDLGAAFHMLLLNLHLQASFPGALTKDSHPQAFLVTLCIPVHDSCH